MPEEFSLVPPPAGLWYRSVAAVTRVVNATLASMGVSSAPPPRAGASYTVIARKPMAEGDLRALAKSPGVFAAVNARSGSFATFPIRVYEGYGMGDVRSTPLDPDAYPFVASFLRVLETPDPSDVGVLFPAEPGEGLISQLVADLLICGVAFIIPTASPDGRSILGLTRAHPGSMTLAAGGRSWEYRAPNAPVVVYARGSVACIRLPSWESNGRGELGTGAGDCLRPIIEAETTAIAQTAQVIEQGGADVVVSGKTDQGRALMGNAAARNRIRDEVAEALKGRGGSRVIAIGGDVEVTPTGLTPADMKAPELQASALTSELMALGCMPITVGGGATTYASGALQVRMQYATDEKLAALFEAFFLRPLVQQFARAARHPRPGMITARFDLSQHEGAAYLRSEAIDRMAKLVDLGWSAAQAASIEGLDIPPPAGPPRAKVSTPSSPVAQPDGGDASASASSGGGSNSLPRPVGEGRRLSEMFPGPIKRADAAGDPREAAWRGRVALREPHEASIAAAAELHLADEADRYARVAHALLQHAVLSGDRRNAGPGTTYAPIDIEALLGSAQDAIDRWVASLSKPWGDSWDAGAADAFLHALNPDAVDLAHLPTVTALPSDYQQLAESCDFIAQFDREEVTRIVDAGMNDGLPPVQIAKQLREADAFSPARALRIARTESARSGESGTLRRYQRVATMGLTVRREWLNAHDTHVRDSHMPMDGQVVGVDEPFTLPSGEATMGPALSGDPGEDCNCRCCTRAVVAKPAA